MMEIDKRLYLRLHCNPAKCFGYDVYAHQDGVFAKEVIFDEVVDKFRSVNSIFTLDKTSAQILIDDLWSAGLGQQKEVVVREVWPPRRTI